MEKFSITEVFSSYLGNHPSASAVVKIEIEGSEEGLFLGVSDPQNRTAFLAVEIHDSVGAQNSSRALLDSSHYMTLQ